MGYEHLPGDDKFAGRRRWPPVVIGGRCRTVFGSVITADQPVATSAHITAFLDGLTSSLTSSLKFGLEKRLRGGN
jgi:hypothetical protein